MSQFHIHKSPKLKPKFNNRPLIDRITNEWRHRNDNLPHHQYEDDYGQFISRRPLPRTLVRKQLRYLIIYAIFLVSVIYTYTTYWLPESEENSRLDMSIKYATAVGRSLGANRHIEFDKMKLLGYLDTKHVPGATSKSSKRLIFIGDVHGCKDELQGLLKQINFNREEDHVVFTGDIVAKGPHTSDVIDIAIDIGASCVRGNHEDRLLLTYDHLNPDEVKEKATLPVIKVEDEHDSTDKPRFLDDSRNVSKKHVDLAKSLNQKQIDYLKSCPVILNVGKIGKKQKGFNYVVAHGGLTPGISLDQQDPYIVMNMRTIDIRTRVPSNTKYENQHFIDPWSTVWNHFQKNALTKDKRSVVIYGHDSKQGLKIENFSKGLDTGCVKGNKLTALILNEKGKESVVSYKCSKDYTK